MSCSLPLLLSYHPIFFTIFTRMMFSLAIAHLTKSQASQNGVSFPRLWDLLDVHIPEPQNPIFSRSNPDTFLHAKVETEFRAIRPVQFQQF
jgi:hypothetical protein